MKKHLCSSNHPSGEMSSDVLVKLAILSVLDKSGTILGVMDKLMKDRSAREMLLGLEYLNHGIIPAHNSLEIKEYLSTLSYKDARKIKRKFRKVYRGLRKNMSPAEGTTLEGIDLWLGQPGKNPDRYQKSGRKAFVRDLLMSNLDE